VKLTESSSGLNFPFCQARLFDSAIAANRDVGANYTFGAVNLFE
jgi:hypothetical protein